MSVIDDREFGYKYHWEVVQKAIRNIDDRRHGRIKSFATPWYGLNEATVGGLDWGSLITIGARPGAGKTMMISNLLRESKILNPTQDFNIVEFQFEMGNESYGTREIVAETGLDYNIVLSSKAALDDYKFKLIQEYGNDCRKLHEQGVYRVQVNKSITGKEIKRAVHYFYNKFGGKPLIVTIDHSWLIKKAPDEKEKLNTLYNTVDTLIELKNELPVIILMVTQLNRTIEDPLRRMPGTIGNYPNTGDIFGGDALTQGSDMVLAMSRPYKFDITAYGPKSYMVAPDSIFLHLLKLRNGNSDSPLLFMKGVFEKQKMIETVEPGIIINSSGYTPRNTGGNRRATSAPIGSEL